MAGSHNVNYIKMHKAEVVGKKKKKSSFNIGYKMTDKYLSNKQLLSNLTFEECNMHF